MVGYLVLFFLKQKTAYEVRISDWSADVCSSDRVGPGAERLLGARQDDDGDVVRRLEVVERRGQLLDQRGAERIQRLRAVERDEADLAPGLDGDVFIGHVFRLFLRVDRAC